jgi:hypothetical protein
LTTIETGSDSATKVKRWQPQSGTNKSSVFTKKKTPKLQQEILVLLHLKENRASLQKTLVVRNPEENRASLTHEIPFLLYDKRMQTCENKFSKTIPEWKAKLRTLIPPSTKP